MKNAKRASSSKENKVDSRKKQLLRRPLWTLFVFPKHLRTELYLPSCLFAASESALNMKKIHFTKQRRERKRKGLSFLLFYFFIKLYILTPFPSFPCYHKSCHLHKEGIQNALSHEQSSSPSTPSSGNYPPEGWIYSKNNIIMVLNAIVY